MQQTTGWPMQGLQFLGKRHSHAHQHCQVNMETIASQLVGQELENDILETKNYDKDTEDWPRWQDA